MAAELKLVDSRWDRRWLEAHPADRAIAERLTAAGQDQQDPAAVAARAAQLQAREGHDVWDRLGAITCRPWLVTANTTGSHRSTTAPTSHRASAAPSCAATKAATGSCSKTRPPFRHSSHSFKHHRADGRAQAAGAARDIQGAAAPGAWPRWADLRSELITTIASRLQRGRQPALVGQLPQQDAAAVPGQAGTVISDLQAVVPAVMLHGEERSSPGDCNVWLPRNLPGPGRSSPMNRLSRPRRSRTRQVHHRFNRCQERIRETPAHAIQNSATVLIQG